MKNIFIYIDDIKTDYSFLDLIKIHLMGHIDETHFARSYNKAIELFETYKGDNLIIDLDYDLSKTHKDDKNGYNICEYIVKNKIPLLFYHIHSMDPEGATSMRALLRSNGYQEFF